VLDAEVAIAVGKPDFTAAAVDASKGELIAEPGLVVLVVHIPPRTVAPDVRRGGVVED
jgi:hypothetical protein